MMVGNYTIASFRPMTCAKQITSTRGGRGRAAATIADLEANQSAVEKLPSQEAHKARQWGGRGRGGGLKQTPIR